MKRQIKPVQGELNAAVGAWFAAATVTVIASEPDRAALSVAVAVIAG